MSAMIETNALYKEYKSGDLIVPALNDININIEEFEFVSMGGPSGSGKTTLLNMLGALDKATSGDVKILGLSLSTLSLAKQTKLRRQKMGFIFQSYNLIPVLTALENTEYILLLQGYKAKERKEMAREMLNQVGLINREHHYPRQLSGGEQQRVAIARAIVSHPKLVLADEPTGNLDSKTSSELLNLMETLHQNSGITFLFSTHDQTIMRRSKRLLWMQDGKITYDGSPQHFKLP